MSEPTTPATSLPAELQNVPVLPLRDVVVYPHMVLPLFVGREKSIQALDVAMRTDKRIMLVAQKQADVDDPKADDLYRIATLATVLQLLKLPDGTVKVLVEGVDRTRIDKLHAGDYYSADATLLPDAEAYDEKEMDVLARSVISQFEQYVKLSKKVPPEVLTALAGIEQAGRLADTVAAHMSLKLAEKQKVLEILDVKKRLEHILVAIESEMDVLQIEKRIRGRVKAQMEKSQREYYLNEQMKAIQKELGEMDEGGNEINELEQKIAKAGMPKEARKVNASASSNKLKMMSPMSAESDRRAQLHRLAGQGALEEAHQDHQGHRPRAKGAGRGPFRAREDQRAHRGVSRRAAARRQAAAAPSSAWWARRGSARPPWPGPSPGP